MRPVLIILIALAIISCNSQQEDNTNSKPVQQFGSNKSVKVILPKSLENRRLEFQNYIEVAKKNIAAFAKKYEWQELTKEDFFDSVMIFDIKNDFNRTLLKLAAADTSMQLPETYCAALEKKTLVAVSPEYYAKVYPEGVEPHSYEKLLTHEIAHRLHVRILKGNEEAMGPIWFYEGFAMFAADQFSKSTIHLDKKEMTEIMNNPDRGSYAKYCYIFRYFANKVPLKELIAKANDKNFNEWLITKIN